MTKTVCEDKIFYTCERSEWRKWLSENFETEKEVWFVFPMKASGKKSVLYNDAVEEALCFGWIDSTIKNLDDLHRIQHFSPRKKGSGYSRLNIERLIRLEKQDLLHPKIRESVLEIINESYVFPEDIIQTLKAEKSVWENYEKFPESYKRIRISYINAARKRPKEFEKRLNNFLTSTRKNKMIKGYGGTEKYYFD